MTTTNVPKYVRIAEHSDLNNRKEKWIEAKLLNASNPVVGLLKRIGVNKLEMVPNIINDKWWYSDHSTYKLEVFCKDWSAAHFKAFACICYAIYDTNTLIDLLPLYGSAGTGIDFRNWTKQDSQIIILGDPEIQINLRKSDKSWPDWSEWVNYTWEGELIKWLKHASQEQLEDVLVTLSDSCNALTEYFETTEFPTIVKTR